MDFNNLIENQGLQLIPSLIFSKLDYRSIELCRRVCKSWKEFIENERSYYFRSLHEIRRKLKNRRTTIYPSEVLYKAFEFWEGVVKNYEEEKNFDELRDFVNFMKSFFVNAEVDYYTPLDYAAQCGNFKMIKQCMEQH